MRRAVAVVALIIIVVLIAVGVNSCENSAGKSALQDYANNVNSVIASSVQTSDSLFKTLRSGVGSADATQVSQAINQAGQSAADELSKARSLSVPGAAKTASSNLIRALQLRLDGITGIAKEIQPALGTSVSKDAVTLIAAEMAKFYASDVLYKQYAAPELVAALHGSGITVGGDGVQINAKQFLPSIQWLNPATIATLLDVALPGNSKKNTASPGLHGHSLTSVAVDGTDLTTGGTNTITASPAPTFTFNLDNGGVHDEYDVKCKVTVTGAGVSGTKVIPETFAGKTATCAVTLSKTPPKGTYSVVATVEKVPGEDNTSNNSKTYPVTFN